MHIPRLHRIQGSDSHHPDTSHLRPTLSVVAVDIRFVEVVDQWYCQSWCNRTQVCYASRDVSWWQKGKSIKHATEMAKVVVCTICRSNSHLLNFPPCALCQVEETELHLYMLPEHSCQSARDSQLEINRDNIRVRSHTIRCTAIQYSSEQFVICSFCLVFLLQNCHP